MKVKPSSCDDTDIARSLIATIEVRRMLASLSLSLAAKDIWSPERERDMTKVVNG